LKLPTGDDLKSLRDRALLSLLLYHGLRGGELSALKVYCVREANGVPHLHILGEARKARDIPLHPEAKLALDDYLEASGGADVKTRPLFPATRNNRTGKFGLSLTPDGVYKLVRNYAKKLGVTIGVPVLRATAAGNALRHGADLVRVQEWLGDADIATTRAHYPRDGRPGESPTFKIKY